MGEDKKLPRRVLLVCQGHGLAICARPLSRVRDPSFLPNQWFLHPLPEYLA